MSGRGGLSALAVLAALAGAPGAALAQAPRAPAAAEANLVSEVEVRGAAPELEARVRELLRTRPGRRFDERDVQDDLEMIATRPGVRRVRWRTEAAPLGLRVVFEIGAEGEAAAPEPTGAEVAGAVRRVEVRGTKRTEADVIELVIKTKPGDALDRRKVTEDVKRIYKTGFYDQVRARLEPEGTGAAVVFEVTERLLISRVEVEGPDDSEKSEIRALMTLKPNTFLNPYEVEKNLREIRKYYANKGYFSADVAAETEEIEDRRAEVIVRIDEGEEQRIQRIRFTGNTAFTDDELRDEIQSGEDWLFGWLTGAGDYKEDLLKADVYFLTNWYLNHGYFKVKVEDADVAADKEGLYLTYAITEGDPYNVKSVAIQGVEDEGEKKLIEDSLQLKAGDLFTRDALQKDIENITTYYSDIGFARAQVDPDFDIDDDAKLLAFTYKIEKGPKVYFDRIRITGNDKTRDKVIRRELLFNEQEQYSGSALKNTKERLEALGYFSEVNINTAQVEGRPDREAVEVNIREGETGTLSGGAGFSSTDSFLFNVRVTNRNLFGRGQSIGFSADIGGKRQDFTVQFTEPYLFDIPLTVGIQLFRSLRVFQDFDREAVGGSVSVSYPIYERIRLGTAWRTELVQVTNVDNDATFFIRSQEGERLTNSMTWSLSRNTYNHPIDPTRGSNTRLSVELAGTVFGGDTDFVKVIGESRWFFPVVYGTTFSFAGRFGWAKGLGGDELPIFERFFLGGIDSVRGYEVNSLGPEIDDDVIGGDKELVFNVEYIFPVIPQANLKGLLFFDAGNAYSEDEDLDITELRLSTGVGVRWLSPLGPLQLAIGFPIIRRAGEDASAVQFSVGAPL